MTGVQTCALPILFADFSNHSAGITNCNHVGRQVFRDNTACTNNDLVANGNARQNNCTCSNPAIFPDVNRHIILINSFSEFRKNRMSSRCNNDTRCKHRIITNINMSVIDHCWVEIGIDIFPEVYMLSAEICMKRRFNITVFADFCKHLL